jgi:hypothetical protein
MRLISRVATAVVLSGVVVVPVTGPAHSNGSVVADTHGCCPAPLSTAVPAAPLDGSFAAPVGEPVWRPANHNGCC